MRTTASRLFSGVLGLVMASLALAAPFRPPAFHPLFTDAERARPHVQARSHDLYYWPYLDGQWEGIVCDPAGVVWFSVSTHSGTEHAQLFRYDPKAGRVVHVADLGQACGEKLTGNPPQDKIHGQMFVEGDAIYAGTCEGHAITGNPYRGGYWLKIDRKTGAITNLVAKPAPNGLRCSLSEDGLLCVGYDPWRKLLYGHTNRKGWLVSLHPATGEEKLLGVPYQDVIDAWRADPDPKKPAEIWPRGLTLMIARDGKVYGCKPPGCTFWCYDPASGKLQNVPVTVPLPADVAAGDKAALIRWQGSALHLTLWDETDQCFYCIRSNDEMLCRFYPPNGKAPGRLEPLQRMGLNEHRYGNHLASCTLVMSGRTLYYTPYTGWGGTANLQSYNLQTKEFVDYGPIVVEGGRRVNECHSMVAGTDGKLYLVAFVFSIDGQDPVNPWGMRDKYPFHPRLVIIDPGTAGSAAVPVAPGAR
jgi:hypothetical protein